MIHENRSILHEHLPLKMPYLVQIFPCYACNFHCEYCIHSLPRAEHGFISSVTFMDLELYKTKIDELKKMGGKLKMLRFAGIGEPLLHPDIAEMVAYASEKEIAESIDIVTNAAKLTSELSDELIASGLNALRVSIEGLSDSEYKENVGANVSFSEIVNNIRYFYENCGNTKVYVKIIDYMLKNSKEKEEEFKKIFAPISHLTAIEHLTPTVEKIDYDKFSGGVDFSLTQDGKEKQNVNICPQPFYLLQINPDGNFAPCCSMKYPKVIESGDINDVWQGKTLTEFRLSHLKNKKTLVCEKCTLYQYGTYPEDVLDGHEKDLIDKYEEFLK